MIPSGTGSASRASDMPASDTPALAKANSGRIADSTSLATFSAL